MSGSDCPLYGNLEGDLRSLLTDCRGHGGVLHGASHRGVMFYDWSLVF